MENNLRERAEQIVDTISIYTDDGVGINQDEARAVIESALREAVEECAKQLEEVPLVGSKELQAAAASMQILGAAAIRRLKE